MIVFGPVPSRRLGQSLGVNNIPPKVCSYSCVYCQVGVTEKPETEPRAFYPPERVAAEVRQRVENLRDRGETIDVITFVPDGEPTLDIHLADAIDLIKPIGLPVAVISNGSLLWQPEVRERLAHADWVSLKLDAADKATWRKVNRPADDLILERVLEGIHAFATGFKGFLATETMLVAGINDAEEQVSATAGAVASLQPDKAYFAIPTRPTAMPGGRGPDPESYACAIRTFKAKVNVVEELTDHVAGAFGFSGDAEADILATTAVHPMSEADVAAFLTKAGAKLDLADALVMRGLLKRVRHGEQTFYVRSHGETT